MEVSETLSPPLYKEGPILQPSFVGRTENLRLVWGFGLRFREGVAACLSQARQLTVGVY